MRKSQQLAAATARAKWVFAILLNLINPSFAADTLPDEGAVKAGRDIAVTSCIACHVVSPSQTIQPVLGPGIPSFQEIANRPSSTMDSLRTAMKVAKWHDPAMSSTLLTMNTMSDDARSKVAAYILSLRSKR